MPTQPNEVWAGDITFIPSSGGWLYLAVIIDLCSRRIVGRALADNLRSDLVIAALAQAIATTTRSVCTPRSRINLPPLLRPT